MDHLAAHDAADRHRLPDLPALCILGWVDTYHGLIVLYTAFSLPYVIWMMRGYIEDIPIELEESALVDGCTRWEVLWKVVFPMVAHRPVRHRGLHLRLRLERVHVRAGADAHRGHHLHRAGDALFRRPVEFLGQDRRHVGARHHPGLHSPWRRMQRYLVRGISMGAVKG